MPDLDLNALLTAKEAAQYAGVTIPVICKWRDRGHLPVATDEQGNEIRDERGRPRYRLLDVAQAEHDIARLDTELPAGQHVRDLVLGLAARGERQRGRLANLDQQHPVAPLEAAIVAAHLERLHAVDHGPEVRFPRLEPVHDHVSTSTSNSGSITSTTGTGATASTRR